MNESTDSTRTSGTRARASNLKKRLQEDGKERIESGKRAAADQIAEIADAIDVAGAQLDQSQPTLANYASQLAEGVGGLATRLREDSIEDIYRDVRQLATRHPGMFLLGSAALGVVIARFMKATGDQDGDYLAGDDLSADELTGESRGASGEYQASQASQASQTSEWSDSTVDVGTAGSAGEQDPSLYRQPPQPGGSVQTGV